MNSFHPSFMQSYPHDQDFDLTMIIRIILRRRNLVAGCVLIALVLAMAYLLVVKTRYRAEAQIQLMRPDSSTLATPAGDSGLDNALDLNLTMETYVGILTSDHLALEVIDKLHLEGRDGYIVRVGSGHSEELAGEQRLPLGQTRYRREALLKQFRTHLDVSIVSGSRLIRVSYLSPDPELAQQVVAHLVTEFKSYNELVRTKAANDSNQSLSRQLDALRTNAENSQQRATELQQNAGIYGTEETRNLLLSRLTDLNQEKVNAEQNLNVKQTILNAISNNGGPEAISNLSGASGQASMPESVNALASIQALRQQKSGLTGQLAVVNNKYGSNNPQVRQIQDQIAALEHEIEEETSRLRNRATNDVATAREQNRGIERQLVAQENSVTQKSKNANSYLIANRNAAADRELFEHLLERSKEMHIMAGVEDNSISIVDSAHVGASPASPNRLLILAGALGGGLMIGLLGVFLKEGMDRRISDGRVMQRLSGAPLLGTLPLAKQSDIGLVGVQAQSSVSSMSIQGGGGPPLWLVGAKWPASPLLEACRSVRTSLLRLATSSRAKVLMVTSASRFEGKSTVVYNLAAVLARQKLKVLVIDADLRGVGLTSWLGASLQLGLSNFMEGDRGAMDARTYIQTQGGVDFLSSGTVRHDPSELLSSKRMELLLASLSESYEYILMDSVPLVPLTDAVALAEKVDAVVVIGRAAATNDALFINAVTLITETSTPILGVICNGLDTQSAEYRYLYGSVDANRHKEFWFWRSKKSKRVGE